MWLDWPARPSGSLPFLISQRLPATTFFVMLRLFHASHQKKLKAGGKECFGFALQPVLCPDPTVSSFSVYLRALLFCCFSLDWSHAFEASLLICIYLYFCLHCEMVLKCMSRVPLKTKLEDAILQCTQVVANVHLVCGTTLQQKMVWFIFLKNRYCRCQVLSTNCFTLQTHFCCSALFANTALLALEEFSVVQTVTVLCHSCYSLWLFSTGCFQMEIIWCKAWA